MQVEVEVEVERNHAGTRSGDRTELINEIQDRCGGR